MAQVVLLPTWASPKLPYYLEPQNSMIFFVMLLGLSSAAKASARGVGGAGQLLEGFHTLKQTLSIENLYL